DAVDLAPTEPDQRHDVGAVEQLGLERGRAGPRLERHGADGAGDHGAAPVGALPDGGRAELLGTFLELLGLQRLLGGEQAPDTRQRTRSTGFIACHQALPEDERGPVAGHRQHPPGPCSPSYPGVPGARRTDLNLLTCWASSLEAERPSASLASRGSSSGISSRGAIACLPRLTTVFLRISSSGLAC